MYQKICGMPKLPDNSDCRLIYRKSADKGARRGWLASFTSLCLYTVRTSDYRVWCAVLGNLGNPPGDNIDIHSTPGGGGRGRIKAAESFPLSKKVKKFLPFCTPTCWGIRPPPRYWSARNYSPGPCHPTLGLLSDTGITGVRAAKSQGDLSQRRTVVLKGGWRGGM